MARKPEESMKMVIVTKDGGKLALEGKGSVVHSMVLAFSMLPVDRRTTMLKSLTAEHAKCLAREAERGQELQVTAAPVVPA